jgi:hypothetical protein
MTKLIEVTPAYLESQRLSPTFPERFWAKVGPPNENGCRLWTGSVRWLKNGIGAHGQLWRGVRNNRGTWQGLIYAHVAAWILTKGPVPEGLQVQHCCPGTHNPLCVVHLKLGTSKDNTHDMYDQGKAKFHKGHHLFRGEENGCSKLTWEKVREIRYKYATGIYTQWDLAHEYGVAQGIISGVVRHAAWIEEA